MTIDGVMENLEILAAVRFPKVAGRGGRGGGEVWTISSTRWFSFHQASAQENSADVTHVDSLNVLALLSMAQAVIPYFSYSRGIIRTSSIAEHGGFPAVSLYCSSTAAVRSPSSFLAAGL